jgi:altronate dehydratase
MVIQMSGGTRKSFAEGRDFVAKHRPRLEAEAKVPMAVSEVIVGTVCGSDGSPVSRQSSLRTAPNLSR